MFDLDPGKLIVIGVVALIAIPSKDLPRVMRSVGQMAGRLRRMSAEFQGQIMEAMREAELSDLKKEIEETNRAIREAVPVDAAFDPLVAARKQIMQAVEQDTAVLGDAPVRSAGGTESAGAEPTSSEAKSAEPESEPKPKA